MRPSSLAYLEGKKLCVVLVKEVDGHPDRARIQCLHGRASLTDRQLQVVDPHGVKFTVPNSALPNVLPSDGTPLLKDAEYFVMVKLHPDIDFIPGNPSSELNTP